MWDRPKTRPQQEGQWADKTCASRGHQALSTRQARASPARAGKRGKRDPVPQVDVWGYTGARTGPVRGFNPLFGACCAGGEACGT